MNINLTDKRDAGYYSHVRTWTDKFQLKSGARVLDIGCGRGQLGQHLKQQHGAIVTGLEIIPENAEIARVVLDRCSAGDIETLRADELGGPYDYIIFSDCLEHLVEPGKTLKKLRVVLEEDGNLLISIPNVRNFRVTWPLIWADQWQYQDSGLLDRTHLRFFTRRSICDLLEVSGYQVKEVYQDLPLRSKVGILNVATLGLFANILTSHYFIQACRKKS